MTDTQPETLNAISKTYPTEDRALTDLRAIRDWPDGGVVLIRILAEIERMMEAQEVSFPALIREAVAEDGETFMDLRCPVCGGLVGDDLWAVDRAERWTRAFEVNAEDQEIRFNFDDRGEFGSTLYFLHKTDHAVSLPGDGWEIS